MIDLQMIDTNRKYGTLTEYTRNQFSIESALAKAHLTTDIKTLNAKAIKDGFRSWNELRRKAISALKALKINLQSAKVIGIDVVYSHIDWLAILLSQCVTTPYKTAMEKLIQMHESLRIENFSVELSAAYKANIIDGWRNVDIESVYNVDKPLIALENLLYLAHIIISFSLHPKRTNTEQTLFGVWDFDFWNTDLTEDLHFTQLEIQLRKMFTESASLELIRLRVQTGEIRVNWCDDEIITAFYLWFNGYLDSKIQKPIQYRQMMVFTAAFFFIGFNDNKSEIVYGIKSLADGSVGAAQKDMIADFLKINGF